MKKLLLLLVTTTMLPPALAVAQSASTSQWAGSIQCQLDVQLQGYARREIQTWTLTGDPPKTAGTGGVAVYPATWTYTGQGGVQRVDGSQMKVIQWAINIVPGEAPIGFVVRDGVLTIRRASAQQRRYTGVAGQRQVAVNGVAQVPTPLTPFPLWEWPLPYIEAAPGGTVSGTMVIPTESFGDGESQSPVSGPRPTASCKYQFTKAGEQ